MTRQDALNVIAEANIPDGIHPLLLVDQRRAWVEIVTELISKGYIEPKTRNLRTLCKNWETLLIKKYSLLN